VHSENAPVRPRQSVRTRFAPNPPGRLGVRGARTALYNWLFARQHGGGFILRIGDVDAALSGLEDEQALIGDLKWVGLDWDEGPDTGGPRGPYRGSERLSSYVEGAVDLLRKGLAYRCFCTERELAEDRARAKTKGLPPRYGRRCASIPDDESERRAASGEPFAVRFRVPDDGEVVVNDLVRGRVVLGVQLVDDFVLLSPSAIPSYNFAAVLDDRAMEVTHVLRGEERLRSTLRQALLYEAMDQRPPAFGHLPAIVGRDEERLSDLRCPVLLEWFRDRGYLPQAMMNYLALLGWSPDDSREVMDVTDLVESFSLAGVSRDAVVFDTTKLSWMNAHYIRSISDEELWRLAQGVIPAKWVAQAGASKVKRAASLVRKRIKRLDELPAEMAPLFVHSIEDDAADVLRRRTSAAVLSALLAELGGRSEVRADEFLSMLDGLKAAASSARSSVFLCVRAAITGRLEGPELGAVAALLGPAELRDRLTHALRAM
jgi:glutamyl-tRNA synthetase